MKFPSKLMDVLRDLVDLVGADDIQEIEVERGWFGQGRIRIVRVSQPPVVQTLPAPAGSAPVSISAPSEGVSKTEQADAEEDNRYHTLKSPMVGMFYRSPNPEAPPYVQEGDEVSSGQTMCIIEAMKIMNEIECDVKGRVVRVLVENASPVEYNTPLFLIDPHT